jgi:hypothetical protein
MHLCVCGRVWWFIHQIPETLPAQCRWSSNMIWISSHFWREDLVSCFQPNTFYQSQTLHREDITSTILGMRTSPVPVRIRMSDYVGVLKTPQQRSLYEFLGIPLTDFGGDTITEIWCETDPQRWSMIVETRATGEGVCRSTSHGCVSRTTDR